VNLQEILDALPQGGVAGTGFLEKRLAVGGGVSLQSGDEDITFVHLWLPPNEPL
jgi:hypothetical protein